MQSIDDIRTFIRESIERESSMDATEIAKMTQRLHPSHSLPELVAMVGEQLSLSREIKLWPKAGPYSL
jgi:hypothetical protein